MQSDWMQIKNLTNIGLLLVQCCLILLVNVQIYKNETVLKF